MDNIVYFLAGMSWLTLVGHISFLLVAASFLMTSMFWLRGLAIASLVLGIGYNAMIAQQTPEIWNVVAWQVLFLAINVFRTIILLVDNMEVTLPEADRQIAAQAFPLMRTRHFRQLVAAGRRRPVVAGEVLLDIGGETEHLILVATGRLQLTDAQGETTLLGRGRMIGDVSLAVGEQYGGSPVTVTGGGGTEVLEIPYSQIRALREKNPEFAYALTDGILRGMAKKARLLLPAAGDDTAAPGAPEEHPLGEMERLVHARALANMSTADVNTLFGHGAVEAFLANEELDSQGRLGIICQGTVMVLREDGQQICLGQGNFLGEVAWVAERDFKVPARLVAGEECQILWMSVTTLARLRQADPLLMARFYQAVMRNMAIKLTWPLTGGEGVGTYDLAARARTQGVGG